MADWWQYRRATPMTNKLTIAFTRREAELYRSHGLLEEARQLYRQVMDEAGTLGPSLAASLQEKIRNLEDELAQLDRRLDAALTGQGGIVFVTGDAGRGKTALMRAVGV